MTRIGIVIARFQTHYLHDGHKALLDTVKSLSDKVVVLLGSNDSRCTDRNPLPFESRRQMVKEYNPFAIVKELPDCKTDIAWSNKVDEIIGTIEALNNYRAEITLYGGRDSFIKSYSGRYKTIELSFEGTDGLSATALREKISSETPINSDEFRGGMIYAAYNKYPVPFPCVDMAVIKYDIYQKILLGRKKDEAKFRLPGGFVDVKDKSLEHAASRELWEECGVTIDPMDWAYIASMKVDDFRYRGTKDGVFTNLFMAYSADEAIAGDDLEEVKWYNLFEIDDNEIVPEHLELINKLRSRLR